MDNSDDQLGNPPEHNPVLTRTSAQTNQNLNQKAFNLTLAHEGKY